MQTICLSSFVQHSHVKSFVYFKLDNKFRYEFRSIFFFCTVLQAYSGIALHIAEEDANPLFGYQKDWCLMLVNWESIVAGLGWHWFGVNYWAIEETRHIMSRKTDNQRMHVQ